MGGRGTLERALCPTFVHAFLRTAASYEDRVAIRTEEGDPAYTFGDLRNRVERVAGGLADLGLGRGHTVALLMSNRPEFHVTDLAVNMVGATSVSIHSTSSSEQIKHVCDDAGVRVAVVDEQFLAAFQQAGTEVEHVITTEDLADIERDGFDAETAAHGVRRDDVATLIYTSGTTGLPKGVQLTHSNVMHFARLAQDLNVIEPGMRVISWLPAAHIAERASGHYIPMAFAGEITCCSDPRRVMGTLQRVRPNWFVGVPRIWEKLKAGIEAMLAVATEEEAAQARDAIADAVEKVRLEQRGDEVPPFLTERVARADDEIFSALREALGLNELQVANVGAAPTPLEVIEFFHAIGIELGEFWGMSETGVATINRPGAVRIGTVGPPAVGMQVTVADDGELMVRGPGVMRGYRGDPKLTVDVLCPGGWIASGDIGSVDEDGYVRVIDRKKELIINSAGKNMSPASIEARIRAASPVIGHVCAIGDRRPYNTALIVLDPEYAEGFASEETMLDAVTEAVATANSKLSRVEQIRRFHVVPGDWLPGGEELTHTMKLRRKPILRRYAEEIEGMYAS